MLQEKTQTRLTKEQIQAVSLLSIGTFLEYFDFMLYVHMSVIFNALFFPVEDYNLKLVVSALSYLATCVLRPLGALMMGYVGDVFGRKTAVVLSTMMMACCCLSTAFLPTYAQIGIAAPIILTIVRMVQGMSASVELNGAQLYISESIKPPHQYACSASVYIFTALGSTTALLIGIFFTSPNITPQDASHSFWRFAFLVGAAIAGVGFFARSSLKEASEFVDRQKMLKQHFKKANIEWSKDNKAINPKIPSATSIAYFCINCVRDPCYYFAYIYCPEFMQANFGLSIHEILINNFFVSIADLLSPIILIYLSYKIDPIKILKAKLVLFFTCIAFFPLAISSYASPKTLLVFQCATMLFMFDETPAAPMFFKHFPVLKRFRYTGLITSLASLLVYLLLAFGIPWMTKDYGCVGILFFLVPSGICFLFGLRYFERKEAEERKKTLARQKSTFSEHF
jgi:MFS transporter, MHS family, proline/betaine transporter